MEARTLNLRECSVRLWRCDLGGQKSASRVVKGVPSAASLSAEHVYGACEASTPNIKVEVEFEGAVVKQELDIDHPRLWRDIVTEPDVNATERDGEVSTANIKVEVDCEDAVVKQELDIDHPRLCRDTETEPDVNVTENHAVASFAAAPNWTGLTSEIPYSHRILM